MAKCPVCETELPGDHAAFDAEILLDYVNSKGGWCKFEEGAYGAIPNSFLLPNGKQAQVVSKKDSYDKGDLKDSYYYDSELPQGTTFDVYVVIRIGDAYFKKTGTGDSYGNISWDGDLRKVTPTVKTIEVFE